MFNATDRTACSRFALSQVAHLAVHSCRGTLRECVLLFHALVRLFACFRSHENTKACESPCESENRDTCGREQKSRQVAADEWVSLVGRTGLEPATSGVTGRGSGVKREELVYGTWIKLLNPRDLQARNAKLASHLASQKFASFGRALPAWNSARFRGTSRYRWFVIGGSQRSATLRNEFPQVAVGEHIHEVHDIAFQRDREAKQRRKTRYFQAALHVRDVRLREAGRISERALRFAAFLAQFAQPCAEHRSFRLRARCHAVPFRLLTRAASDTLRSIENAGGNMLDSHTIARVRTIFLQGVGVVSVPEAAALLGRSLVQINSAIKSGDRKSVV